jgi:hypothetical protein
VFGRARTELYLSGCETNWNDFAIKAEISRNRYFALAKNPDLSSLRKRQCLSVRGPIIRKEPLVVTRYISSEGFTKS